MSDSEFKSRLLYADERAKLYLDKLFDKPLIPADEDIEHKAVVESYLKAFDVTSPGSENAKIFAFHVSNFFFRKSVLLIGEIKELIKQQNYTLSSKELKILTDEITGPLDSLIKENDRNKAAYIKKRADLISAFESELAKNGITVKKEGCYIATAVYGSYDCPQVLTLRRYRDETLSKSSIGRAFTCAYYGISPALVRWFGKNERIIRLWRRLLDLIITNL